MSNLSDFIATGSGGGSGTGNEIVSDTSLVSGSSQVENIVYGTAAPPDPLPDGTIYIQTTAS